MHMTIVAVLRNTEQRLPVRARRGDVGDPWRARSGIAAGCSAEAGPSGSVAAAGLYRPLSPWGRPKP